ncbi:formimidoylglutamate deiminase [Azospirillum thermophilum]|uniref:Formimidoylglutamate deiminase n=1 Tax=Azospirillum thermophilum TaxID=2202148 RepID=A0A2S2CY60_9PROT|nr:formimidoylglutamate deiminase [Azospirillum thermophilum]AWK89409.1 formimidoylglutamate deiminase [Azospirillum thermophilum]
MDRLTGLFCDRALLPDGWAGDVALRFDAQGALAAVEVGAAAGDLPRAAGPVIPGMPNLHSHAFQRAMAGLAERAGPSEDSFWTWREAMYGFVRRLTPDAAEAIAALLYMEMLKQGYTAVAEFHYLHHDTDGRPYADRAEMSRRILAAADTAGIGLTHLPVLYAHSGFGGRPPSDGQRRFINDVDGLLSIVAAMRGALDGRAGRRVGLALHSLRAVTPEEMRDALAGLEAIAPGAPIHIHIAEQTAEVDDCVAWSGRRPVEWLLDNAPVDGRWCLVHATHLTGTEVTGLAATGAVAGLCPTTEANLGDGLFPAVPFLAQGGRFGVGSDSHISVSAAEELRILEYGQRLVQRRRNVLRAGPGASIGSGLYQAAVAGGARALGQPAVEGGIRVGQPADLVVLDADNPKLLARRDDSLLDAYVFAGDGHAVRDVIAAGRPVVRDGRHLREDAITAAYRRALAALGEAA